LLWVAAFGLACGAAPPGIETTRYLMRSDAQLRPTDAASPAALGLRRVAVAAYLKEPGLVLETEPSVVRNARHHRWAEPLEFGLRSLLRAELSAALGSDVDDDASRVQQWDVAIDVDVDQLHGTASGEARLVAAWRLVRVASGDELARHRYAHSEPLARAGHAALAEAEISLARQLAVAIAQSLRALPSATAGPGDD
jgi:uncharacterized lipoprotein YmbA